MPPSQRVSLPCSLSSRVIERSAYSVAARPRADPKDRPLLAWIQKHHLRATEIDVDPSSLNTVRYALSYCPRFLSSDCWALS
jgi:hypothetical protein